MKSYAVRHLVKGVGALVSAAAMYLVYLGLVSFELSNFWMLLLVLPGACGAFFFFRLMARQEISLDCERSDWEEIDETSTFFVLLFMGLASLALICVGLMTSGIWGLTAFGAFYLILIAPAVFYVSLFIAAACWLIALARFCREFVTARGSVCFACH